jgi:ferric-dicitrate binding protein FerR (iron transport regulator)
MSIHTKDDMRDNPQRTPEQSPELHAAITHALEAHPAVRIPPDFAARLRASLPPPAPARRSRSSATRVGIVAAALLLVAAFCLAPHAAPNLNSVAFDLELAVIAELACVTAWLASVRRGTW